MTKVDNSELKVPYALDNCGTLTSPALAEKGQSYSCPGCREPVTLKKGDIMRPHYAHKANTHCTQESILHSAVKMRIRDVINDLIRSGYSHKSPIIKRKCQQCGTETDHPIEKKYTHAENEKAVGKYIVDVALYEEDVVTCAIEVCVTHEVGDSKQNELGIPFIEIDAQTYLDAPMVWRPTIDALPEYQCETCTEAIDRFKEELKRVSRETRVNVPHSYYRTAVEGCWKCGKDILVFAWPGATSDKEPEIPRPRTLERRYTKMSESTYWANTCPYCNSVQGAFFLHHEPDGPFFAVSCEEEYMKDTPESFKNDMHTIALSSMSIHY